MILEETGITVLLFLFVISLLTCMTCWYLGSHTAESGNIMVSYISYMPNIKMHFTSGIEYY